MTISSLLCVGVRLARAGGRRGMIRLAVTVLVVGFATVVLVAVTSVPGVIEARRLREAAREPSPELVDGSPTSRLVQVRDDWKGRSITRVVVESTADGPVPPGLDQVPAPGTSALSPGLWRAIEGDPSLGRRFPSPTHEIDRAGLVSDRDLLAYVGVEPGTLAAHGRPVQRYGLRRGTVDTIGQRLLWQMLFGGAVFVLAPVAGVVVGATRLAATARSRRWQAIRVLGAPAWSVRILVAIEALLGASFGVAAGIAAVALRPRSGILEVGGTSVFAADLHPPAKAMVLVASLLPGFACGVALIAASTATRLPMATRPSRTSARRSWVAAAPLGVALLLLLVVLPLAKLGGASFGLRRDLVYVALVLSGVGTASILGVVVQRAMGRVAPRCAGPSAVLAARSLASDPGAFTRMVGLLTTGVLAMGFAQVAGSRFDSEREFRRELVELQRNGGRPLAQVMSGMEPGIPLGGLGQADGVRAAFSLPMLHDRPEGEVVGQAIVATCADLQQLTVHEVHGCVDGRVGHLALRGEASAAPAGRSVLRGRDGWVEIDAAGAPAIDIQLPIESGLDAFVVVPPSDPGLIAVGGPSALQTEVVLTTAPDALDRLRDRVPQLQPDALVQVAVSTSGADEYVATSRWFVLATGAALALGGIGLLLTAADGLTERRRRIAALAVIGAPRAALRRAAFLEVLIPLALAAAVSMVMVVLNGLAQVALFRSGAVDVDAVLRLSLGAIGVSLAIAWVTSLRVSTRLRPDLLRQEH